jgi:hypothetical protein
MTRRARLLGSLAFCAAQACGSVHAQVPVIDGASLLSQAKALLQDVKAYALQAQQYLTELQQLEQQVQLVMNFVHDPSLGAAMGLMNTAGLGNDLPFNPAALQGLANGYSLSLNGLAGRLSLLSSLANSSYGTNHLYSPNDGSASSNALNARGVALSGMQGAALTAYADLRNHLPIIQALRDRLNGASNMKDVADAAAALQAESTWTQNLQAEVAAADMQIRLQSDVEMQRDQERIARDIDAFADQARAEGMGLGQ